MRLYAYATTREEAEQAARACSAPLTDRRQAERECAGLNAYWQRMARARLAKARKLEVFELDDKQLEGSAP